MHLNLIINRNNSVQSHLSLKVRYFLDSRPLTRVCLTMSNCQLFGAKAYASQRTLKTHAVITKVRDRF